MHAEETCYWISCSWFWEVRYLPYAAPLHVRLLERNGNKSIAVIISPLNALIEDQVSINLNARGVRAGIIEDDEKELLHSEDESDLLDTFKTTCNYGIAENETLNSIQKAEIKLLFTHPEAFISCKDGTKLFQSDFYQERVMFRVIDEAHLVYEWGSEWGSELKVLPAWLSVSLRSHYILALTATAPTKLIEFLKENLHIKDPFNLVGNLDRPNIFICKSKRRPSSLGAESVTLAFYSPSPRSSS